MIIKIINNVIIKLKMLKEKMYSSLAGMLSFFLILSIVPLIFLILLGLNNLNYDINLNYLNNKEISYIILRMINNIDKKNYSIFFVLTSIYSSSTLFYHLIKAGELIFNKKNESKLFFYRINAILNLFVFSFLLLFLIFFNQKIINKFNFFDFFVFKIIFYFLILFLLCLFLHKYTIPLKLNFKIIKKGVLLNVILWMLTNIFFTLYINYFADFTYLYGTFSFFIVILLYIYLLMQCFIISLIYTFNFHKKSEIKF